jgi:hypothetical protein
MIVVGKIGQQRIARGPGAVSRAGRTSAKHRAQSQGLGERQQEDDESLHVARIIVTALQG